MLLIIIINIQILENQLPSQITDNKRLLAVKQGKAAALNHLGKYTKALEVYQEIAPEMLQMFGELSYEYLALEHEIALTMIQLEQYDEAIIKLKKVLEQQQNVLGDNDDSTLLTLSDLAMTLERANKLEEALALYEENKI
jgi:tetratricopeptide (TPR) repeat protein